MMGTFQGERGGVKLTQREEMEVPKAGRSCDPFFLDFVPMLQRNWTEISPGDVLGHPPPRPFYWRLDGGGLGHFVVVTFSEVLP